MSQERFRPHHIPKYSRVFFEALKTPLLIYFAVCGNFLTFVTAYLFYIFEVSVNPNVTSYWDSVWWALCTVSTVGYGDIVPMTVIGRLCGLFLIVVGVAFFLSYMAVLVSVMASVLAEENASISKE